MNHIVILLVVGLLTFKHIVCVETELPRIAIVGGGIGGASTSHFLTELFNGNLQIDLYEAKIIGGRLATVKIDNDEFEAGGAVIHSRNMYMQKFLKLLGLEYNPSSDNGRLGIWNGDEFVFEESSWKPITMVKLLYRYGFQLFKLQGHVNDVLNDFSKIYAMQDTGKSFANVTALLSAMNKEFPKLLQTSMKDYLIRKGFTKTLIDELAKATVVVNYGQDTNIQSFVGLVSIAGAGNDLWSIKNGNKEVPEHLIYRNKNVNVVPSRVTRVRYIENSDSQSPQYEVTYANKDGTDLMTSNYDIVIIAAPLTNDQAFPVEFIGFPKNFIFSGKYQTTYATFVKADLNPKYFGLKEPLGSIISCNTNKTIISSIGKVFSVKTEKDSRVWKIFSKTSLQTDVIHNMFSHIDEKKEIIWKAYPYYTTNSILHNFKLHDALYHVNAIEWAASAMEMSAVAGRNVAILAHDDFQAKHFTNKKETFTYSNMDFKMEL